MILTKVELENYKQYVDRHEIEIPTVATIGVIGSNGVGKTTLFEAIEWALYNPTTIKAAEIRPRGRSGFTKVTLTLDDPARERRYIIERELKRASVTATLFEVDASGEEKLIVQGTKPVTEYVATHLIGLSHRAFVATFFTRQKELSFFGTMGDTDRRREVGRLLGLETIRTAQQAIAEDRKKLAADALSYRRQYDDQLKGRDFAAELEAARETIVIRTETLATANARVETAHQIVTTHEASLQAIEALRERDVTLAQQLAESNAERQAAASRRDGIDAELTRLAQLESERAQLVQFAEPLPRLTAELAALEESRTRYLKRRELEQRRDETAKRFQDQQRSLATTIRAIDASRRVRGWQWTADDERDPHTATERCLRIATSIPLRETMAREQQLATALDASIAVEREHTKLQTYLRRQDALRSQLAISLAEGDPTAQLQEIGAQRDALQRELSDLQAQQSQRDTQITQARGLITNLTHQHFGDRCPTCARPFGEHDAEIVVQSLQAQVATHETANREALQRQQEIRQTFSRLDAERAREEQRATEIAKARNSLDNSVAFVDDQQLAVERASDALASALVAADLRDVPTADDLAAVREEVALYQRIADTRSRLAEIRDALAQLTVLQDAIARDLTPLADATFDEAHYREIADEQKTADRARTAITQIDRELARRSDLVAERTQIVTREATLTASITALTEERRENGFDAAALEAVQRDLRQARIAEKDATEQRHAAEIALRDAEQARANLERDQARIADLAVKADASQRDADTADRMYREFTEFDKYAAAHYTPILSDMTSDLVRDVTDGKYDRVEFDHDYGIEVYDGTEERFPLASFSGGERDAISLCARIALSRMIGSQAASPPGFLVLDEVFGSLDRDRRTRLLDMLGRIASSGDGFQQMFIISHVDDVRMAPMLDEIWRVEESADGESQIVNLAVGTEIDEL